MRINPTKKIVTRRTVTNVGAILETLRANFFKTTLANVDYTQLEKRDWNGDYSAVYKRAGK